MYTYIVNCDTRPLVEAGRGGGVRPLRRRRWSPVRQLALWDGAPAGTRAFMNLSYNILDGIARCAGVVPGTS